MSEKGQFLGLYFRGIHGLLVEYNPEIAEEVSKNLPFDANEIATEEWYPISDYFNYLRKLSSEAILGCFKLMAPAILKQEPQLRECSDPAEMIEKVQTLSNQAFRNMEPDRAEILESGDNFLKVRVHTVFHEFPNMWEGVYRAVFAEFKIINPHVKLTKEADNALLFEFNWE